MIKPEGEERFFYWLGYRLFTTVLRGYQVGHRRPLSAARDYLRIESVTEGVERKACEFLVDVAKAVGSRRDKLSLEELFEKWSEYARWRPELKPRHEYSNEQRAFIRGYTVAVSEFSRCETTPKRVLASAGITRKFAVEADVLESDLEPLSGQFADDRVATEPSK